MAICYSSSWSSTVISSAWWVYDHQVSKVAPSGEYLSHGSFMIRGKKNFMPASPLVLGFGILFRLDEESVANRRQKMAVHDVDSSTKTVETKQEKEELPVEEQEVDVDEPDEEYPDIQLDVPTVNYRNKADPYEDYMVIDFSTKNRPKKQAPGKEKETMEYLEKKKEEERKAAAGKKVGKRQKHKMDKIRKKYRDQDEDEREMRLALLGSRGKQGKPESKPTTGTKQDNVKAKSDSGGGEERVGLHATPEALADSRDDANEDNTVVSAAPNGQNNEGSRVQEHSKGDSQMDSELGQMAALQINDRKDAKATSAGGLHDDKPSTDAPVMGEDDEEGKDDVVVSEDSEGLIAQLTSNPTSEDVLLYAVPMVGPYQALSNFKYRVKITPGTARKGKAGKAALDLFLRMKNGDPREQALIRALVGDENACRNIPKGCRISAPQLYAK
ncbi:hypothetical protein COOONC_26088 [Cooperia oncophora]